MGVAVFAATQVFFKIHTLAVEGTSRYTNEEIWQTAQVNLGDNLLFLSAGSIKTRLLQTFPYMQDVQITRHWPGGVTLTIVEKQACGYLEQGGNFWMIDNAGTLLEKTASAPVSGLPRITGVTLLVPKPGEKAAFAETDANRVAPLYALLQALCRTQILADVTEVDVSEPYALQIRYKERFTIQLGMPENLMGKLNDAADIETYLDSTRGGVINMASSPALFQPEKPSPEEETP